MKNGVVVTIIIIFILLISIYIGYYLYKINNIENANELSENTMTNNMDNITNNIVTTNEIQNTLEANSQEERTTPNTEFILKKRYKECNNTTKTYVEILSELINLTEKELQEQYKDWKVEKFSKKQVVLEKEEDGRCDEHFMLKEKDGYIVIYKINKDKTETLKQETKIAVEYLTQEDLINIQHGYEIHGVENLNSTIEDYE